MNFYNENEEEKKEGAPVLPRAASPFKKTSAFGKSPMFSRAAGGIMDRLKNLSRRDMTLVGLGLSVLVMVPVGEYMMSQPTPDNVLSGGFGSKEGMLNPNGSGPYEPGVNGLSQGSADGSGEVITPLGSRDPVSLILGSQPAQPAAAPPVYTPPSTGLRDAMKDAGRAAFSEASKAAGAPTVIPRMQAAMRSMSFFTGGESSRTAGTLSDGKIIQDAKSASAKAAKRNMVGPVAIAGYKGVASTPNSASKDAFEKLRSAADKSAGNFNGDSAIRSLDKAAADALDIGKSGGGMGSGQDSDKTAKTSNNTTKNENNASGECNTLACQAQKLRMQKALDWEFFKKYEIPKQIINAVVGAVSTSLGKFIGNGIDGVLNPDPPAGKCWVVKGNMVGTADHPNYEADIPACRSKCAMPSRIKSTTYGKDGTAGIARDYCPCGTGPKPTDDCADPKGDASASGNPPAKPGDTSTGAPQISAVVTQSAKGYDEALKNVLLAIDAYGKVAKKNGGDTPTDANVGQAVGQTVSKGVDQALTPKTKSPEEQKVETALTDSFTKLHQAVTGSGETLENAVNNANQKAQNALTAFQGAVTDASNVIRDGQCQKDLANIAKLKQAAEAGTTGTCSIKMNDNSPVGVEKVTGNGAAGQAQCKLVLDAIVADEKEKQPLFEAKGLITAANAILDKQKTRLQAYSTQFGVMTGAVGTLVTNHAEVPKMVTDLLATTDPMAKKLVAIAGTDQAMAADSAKMTKDGEKDPVPLRRSAVQLRGFSWESVTSKKFDFSAAAGVESKAWDLFNGAIASGNGSATMDAPANFTASLARATAMATDANGFASALSKGTEIGDKISAANSKTRDSVERLKGIVAPCNFDGSCGGSVATNTDKPTGTDNPPVSNNVAGKVNPASNLTNDHLGRVSGVLAQAEPDAIISGAANLPANADPVKKQAAVASAGELKDAKANLAAAQQNAVAVKNNPAATKQQIADASNNLGKAEMAYNDKLVKARNDYTAARPTGTALPKPETAAAKAKREDIAKASSIYDIVRACYGVTSGFKPGESARCKMEIPDRNGTSALVTYNDLQRLSASNDPASRSVILSDMQNEQNTAYTWASGCLIVVPARCHQ